MHKGIGGRDRRYQLERIVAVIEEQNPDIICLQEVDRHVRRSKQDDQPRLLAEKFCAAAHQYQLNVHLQHGGYGNLMISRWPFATQHQMSLRHYDKKARGAQLAVVATPEGAVHVAHWHLGLSERERHWQARHLLGHHLFLESAELPTIIVGDTNDWRNSLAAGPMSEHGFEHVTAPPSRFRSFPAWLAMGSLDKAYVRGKIRVVHAHLVRSPLARAASDHLPLVIDFHVTD